MTTNSTDGNLLQALSELRVPPAGLALRVLEAAGIGDVYDVVESALGPVAVAHNPRGVSCVDLLDDAAAFEQDFVRTFHRPLRRGSVPVSVARALVSGESAGIEIDLRGRTAFEQAVLRCTAAIPRGEVRPYGWVAREIGRERAVRAVGTALAHNPVPLLVPCHRVVRSDGRMGNYSLGSPQNKWVVLRYEGLDPAGLETLAAQGVRQIADLEERTAHLPSCGRLRGLGAVHSRGLRSTAEAQALGLAACSDCRPYRA